MRLFVCLVLMVLLLCWVVSGVACGVCVVDVVVIVCGVGCWLLCCLLGDMC